VGTFAHLGEGAGSHDGLDGAEAGGAVPHVEGAGGAAVDEGGSWRGQLAYDGAAEELGVGLDDGAGYGDGAGGAHLGRWDYLGGYAVLGAVQEVLAGDVAPHQGAARAAVEYGAGLLG